MCMEEIIRVGLRNDAKLLGFRVMRDVCVHDKWMRKVAGVFGKYFFRSFVQGICGDVES